MEMEDSQDVFHGFELFSGLCGVVSTLLVLISYKQLPTFREHPAGIVLIVSIFDCMLALKFLIRGSAWLSHPANDRPGYSFHLFNDNCTSSIAWSAIFETSSVVWNAIWCLHFTLLLYGAASAKAIYVYSAYWLSVVSVMTGVQVALGYYQQSQTSGDYVFCAQHRKGTHFTGAMILDTATVYLHLAVAIGAVLAAFCRVQCGNGAHTRGMLTRQYIYTGVLVALWGLERGFSFSTEDDAHAPSGKHTFHQIVGIVWQAQGAFVAIVRLSEPGLLRQLYHSLCGSATGQGTIPTNLDPATQALLQTQDSDSPPPGVPYFDEEGAEETSAGTWGPSQAMLTELELKGALGPRDQRNRSQSARAFPTATQRQVYQGL
eukprot:m.126923 g.126923  ORF g.126923 m.126923 type:complete len:375 (+) comp13846_c1_seq5:84-1208(+)